MKTLESQVSGIPCVVKYEILGGYVPATSTTPEEFEEVEFKIYDRNGRRASWLENKMNTFDYERIERECMENGG
jgi:hypothetical protein